MLIFLHINYKGITWLFANSNCMSKSHNVCDFASALKVTQPGEYCGIVAWNAQKQINAIQKMCMRQPSAKKCDILDILKVIEISDCPADKELCDANTVAATYFSNPIIRKLFPVGANPSTEQWVVANATKCDFNIVCNAVAGAGKTTTLLLCAALSPSHKHLLLTYNKRLQLDVDRRVRDIALTNIKVMTYHSAAGKSYGGIVVRNDDQFRNYVQNAPETPLRFDVILVDEAQDMSVEYFALVRYLLAANPGSRIIVVGDELQAINTYRGAHPGFLTEAATIYDLHQRWISCKLSISQRLTPATAAFVNTHLYNANIIVGGNHRNANRYPIYVGSRNFIELPKLLAKEVVSAIEEFGPDGVFVLAPSVRNLEGKSPLAQLIKQHLVGIPTFVGGNDDESVNDDLIRGKLAILSFNASKGCERPCVIVVGLDETYFEYYNTTWEHNFSIPNVLTVAATRASQQLVIVANSKKSIRTINIAHLKTLAIVKGFVDIPSKTKNKSDILPISVTQLVRGLHPNKISKALEILSSAQLYAPVISRKCPKIIGKHKFVFNGITLTEDLVFVYGLLAPVLAEVQIKGTTKFGIGLDTPIIMDNNVDCCKLNEANIEKFYITTSDYNAYPHTFWENISSALLTDCQSRSPTEWASIAILKHAFKEGRHHIARQVTDYKWVNTEALIATRDIVLNALSDVIGNFEVKLPTTNVDLKSIRGIADFIEQKSIMPAACDPERIWEFKLGPLCSEHKLQLACYLAMRGGGEGRLFSITCDEMYSIYLDPVNSQEFLKMLVKPTNDIGNLLDIIASIDMKVQVPQAQEIFAPLYSLDDLV